MKRDRIIRIWDRKLNLSPGNDTAEFFITILPSNMPPEEEEAASAQSGVAEFLMEEHLPEHETFADYLIERSLAVWTRSQG
jgi:hypothetical protein